MFTFDIKLKVRYDQTKQKKEEPHTTGDLSNYLSNTQHLTAFILLLR